MRRGPRRVLLSAALLCMAAAAGAGLLRPAPAAAGVTSKTDAILEHNGFGGRLTGVVIWDFSAGRLVYALNKDQMIAPASNMKLVTTLSALNTWGPDHSFKTELYGPDAAVSSTGVLTGDLYLKGYGDPSLSTRAYQRSEFGFRTASFERFAKRLKRLKVRRVDGRVLGDESFFDTLRDGPTWTPNLQLESGTLSALTGNESLDNGRRVKEPARYAALLMTEALEAKGIEVTGVPGIGTVPETARLYKQQFSAPLKTLLRRMDKNSDNFFAEIFTKGVGKQVLDSGSTQAGVEVSRRTLDAVGIDPDSYVLVDGSGLSYQNRLTAADLSRVVGAARQRADGEVFYDALAIAGVDGTLVGRMRNTRAQDNARAKTGTLAIATCLSGYVTSANHHDLGYAILMGGDPVDWWRGEVAQDELVAMLAKSRMTGRRGARISPTTRQIPVGASDPVNPVGGHLEPVVQP
jgi:serine-type D-Ala-D-Ala carboxypeptidase/endopeptidase (penicillin-binding protein 4)